MQIGFKSPIQKTKINFKAHFKEWSKEKALSKAYELALKPSFGPHKIAVFQEGHFYPIHHVVTDDDYDLNIYKPHFVSLTGTNKLNKSTEEIYGQEEMQKVNEKHMGHILWPPVKINKEQAEEFFGQYDQ